MAQRGPELRDVVGRPAERQPQDLHRDRPRAVNAARARSADEPRQLPELRGQADGADQHHEDMEPGPGHARVPQGPPQRRPHGRELRREGGQGRQGQEGRRQRKGRREERATMELFRRPAAQGQGRPEGQGQGSADQPALLRRHLRLLRQAGTQKERLLQAHRSRGPRHGGRRRERDRGGHAHPGDRHDDRAGLPPLGGRRPGAPGRGPDPGGQRGLHARLPRGHETTWTGRPTFEPVARNGYGREDQARRSTGHPREAPGQARRDDRQRGHPLPPLRGEARHPVGGRAGGERLRGPPVEGPRVHPEAGPQGHPARDGEPSLLRACEGGEGGGAAADRPSALPGVASRAGPRAQRRAPGAGGAGRGRARGRTPGEGGHRPGGARPRDAGAPQADSRPLRGVVRGVRADAREGQPAQEAGQGEADADHPDRLLLPRPVGRRPAGAVRRALGLGHGHGGLQPHQGQGRRHLHRALRREVPRGPGLPQGDAADGQGARGHRPRTADRHHEGQGHHGRGPLRPAAGTDGKPPEQRRRGAPGPERPGHDEDLEDRGRGAHRRAHRQGHAPGGRLGRPPRELDPVPLPRRPGRADPMGAPTLQPLRQATGALLRVRAGPPRRDARPQARAPLAGRTLARQDLPERRAHHRHDGRGHLLPGPPPRAGGAAVAQGPHHGPQVDALAGPRRDGEAHRGLHPAPPGPTAGVDPDAGLRGVQDRRLGGGAQPRLPATSVKCDFEPEKRRRRRRRPPRRRRPAPRAHHRHDHHHRHHGQRPRQRHHERQDPRSRTPP